jgi:hypothetical protein
MVLALEIFGVLVLGLIALFAIGLASINFPRRCRCCKKLVWRCQRGKKSHEGYFGSTIQEEDNRVHRQCQERRARMHPVLGNYLGA